VWPVVRQSVPDAQLVLVGRDPGPAVRGLAGPGVEVAGTVPDVAPYIQRAAFTVAPLLAGGGSRLKILESLGWARGVVATTIGASGLEGLGGAGIVLADEPAQFAAEVVRLLEQPEQAARLGEQGRQAVRAYAWDTVLAPFSALWTPTSGPTGRRDGGPAA
jgi:glycosyltransferase involved in cell wall biosynthesis